MAGGRFSTIKYNEWICVTAQYEKTVSRIGKQVYQGWTRGLVKDHGACQLCEDISNTFKEAKLLRRELEEEIERDALEGLSYEESKAVDEIRDLTPTKKFLRELKVKFARFTTKAAVHKNLQSYRDQVRNLSRDLGLRAVNQYENNPLLQVKGHRELCLLAVKLDENATKKWEEITKSNKEEGSSLSFHTMLVSFTASFAEFSKDTKIGQILLKLAKYDAKEEKKKLKKSYQGSDVQSALEEQLQEDEPIEFDAAKEMANMEREYSQSPEQNLPGPAATPKSHDRAKPSTENRESQERAQSRSEKPSEVTQANLGKSPENPSPPSQKPEQPKREPQVLRRKPEPENWSSGPITASHSGQSAPPPSPSPAAPSLGQSTPPPSPSPAAPRLGQSAPPPPPSPAAPRLGQSAPPPPPSLAAPTPPKLSDSTKVPAVEPPPPFRPPASPAAPVPSEQGSAPSPPHRTSLPAKPASFDDDDELLPAFLRDRSEDDSASAPFVPELPDFLKDDPQAPKLDIIPFGKESKPAESGEDKPFIPKMPD